MDLEAARAMKAQGCWGEQEGLLSASEMVALGELVKPYPTVLEVGHYHGLSTWSLHGKGRTVVTVDSHHGDAWVPQPARPEKFLANMRALECIGVVPLFIDSKAIVAPICFPFVFYDGDHGPEQLRFTQAVIASPAVELFVFDDRDFPFPELCCQELRDAGWRDASLPCVRGPRDKQSEETMTLGVFAR